MLTLTFPAPSLKVSSSNAPPLWSGVAIHTLLTVPCLDIQSGLYRLYSGLLEVFVFSGILQNLVEPPQLVAHLVRESVLAG